jgi:hypothetical protein
MLTGAVWYVRIIVSQLTAAHIVTAVKTLGHCAVQVHQTALRYIEEQPNMAVLYS